MTLQTAPHILIVDDDEHICKSLSAILQAEGYKTTTATNAKAAMEKMEIEFFNVTLLDIKLPDMEGTQLLAKLQETNPETIKIMVTGYPSLQNAVEALNLGAESYIMKPINPAELLKTIKDKLEAKQQAEKITKEKLSYWIQSQARKSRSSNFQEYLEETAKELTDFGITKTQAKIYITIVALGVASASEIAATSKIRREEIYRIIPKLENQGLVIRKLKAPRKFSAIQPEKAIQILTKTKLKAMKEEVEKLKQKQAQLVPKLKTIELPIQPSNCSTEIISQRDNVFDKLMEITKNAKHQIDVIAPLHDLRIAYANRPRKLMERILKSVKMRIITNNCELGAFTKRIMRFSEANNNPIELRQVEKLLFNLLIVDDKEAMWGESQPEDENAPNYWTDNPTQIAILKMSFESLWKKSSIIKELQHP